MEHPTLRTLLSEPPLALRLVTPETKALDRPLRWVHSSDLLDPTPFLADDLALLTTGTQFAQRAASHQADYVARLVRRRVIGLGFGRDVALPEIPTTLQKSCTDAGIALFEVPYATPFIAVARAHAEAMATERDTRRAARLAEQRRLASALLTLMLRDEPTLTSEVLAELPTQALEGAGTQLAASAFLAPLRGTELVRTLRTWLDHDARFEPAAAELGIHRHTLRTRIGQAGDLLGLDLSTFPARAEVWAALQGAS